MKLATYILCIFLAVCVNSKKIKIQIDTDDIMKILTGFMNINVFNKFTNQVGLRTAAQYKGYSNPYHPEDDLVNRFDEAIDKQMSIVTNKPQINNDKDPLDKENDNFILDPEGTSHDELTDNESSKTSTMGDKNIEQGYKSDRRDDINKKDINLQDKYNGTVELIPSRKDGVEDRTNFKPLQKRFLLKYSGGN